MLLWDSILVPSAKTRIMQCRDTIKKRLAIDRRNKAAHVGGTTTGYGRIWSTTTIILLRPLTKKNRCARVFEGITMRVSLINYPPRRTRKLKVSKQVMEQVIVLAFTRYLISLTARLVEQFSPFFMIDGEIYENNLFSTRRGND